MSHRQGNLPSTPPRNACFDRVFRPDSVRTCAFPMSNRWRPERACPERTFPPTAQSKASSLAPIEWPGVDLTAASRV